MARLWAELIGLFFLLPLAVVYWIRHLADWLMPILGFMGVGCLALLLADKQFKRFRLWHMQDFSKHLGATLKLFVPWACLTMVLVYLLKPEIFMRWPLEQPGLWVTTLLIYPVVSVIPQEIIFRTFFFHRYKKIIPSKHWRWGLSTFVFGLAHLVYGNWIAVVVSWLAGALFGYRYMQTRSTPLVVIEHAIWGSFAFTVGLGTYLVMSSGVQS